MDLIKNKALLNGRLGRLSPRRRSLFASSCAERLFPLYPLGNRNWGHGDPQFFRSLLDEAWDCAREGRPPRGTLQKERIIALIPDEDEDGWTPSRSLALNAAVAVANSSECLHDPGNSMHAVFAWQQGFDVAFYFAETLDKLVYLGPEHDDNLDRSERIQDLVRKQERDLADVEGLGSDETGLPELAERLRARAASESDLFVQLAMQADESFHQEEERRKQRKALRRENRRQQQEASGPNPEDGGNHGVGRDLA